MLDGESVWIDEFRKIAPASTAMQGLINLADKVKELTDKIDPDVLPTSTFVPNILPRIFQFNKPIFIAQLLSISPTQSSTWIAKIAAAWAAACSGGVITPSLVTDSTVWPISSMDVSTAGSGGAAMPTISAGQAAIIATMQAVPAKILTNPREAQEAFAKAFRNGARALSFTLIGIGGTPITPVPIPITVPGK